MDLTGQKFGKLLVIKKLARGSDKGECRTYYMCKCDCGKYKDIQHTNLVSKHTLSCGCLRKEYCVNNRDELEKRRQRGILSQKENAQTVSYQGLTLSIRELAARTGLSQTLIRWRLKHGWSVDNALSTENLITYKGVTRTAEEWSLSLGFNKATVGWRLKHGWSIAEALTLPKGAKRSAP